MAINLPSEVELPVEAAPRHVGGGDVLERVVRYHVDYRADHRLPRDDAERTVRTRRRTYLYYQQSDGK